MKKAIFLVAIVFLTSASLMAQTKDQDKDRDQDRLMLVDGDVLYIRDQQQIRLQDKITLNDGTVINPDGTYQTKDRKRPRLQNGECLDMDGMKYSNEYQYRQKVKQGNSGLSQAQNQNRVHYMLVDGEVYQIRNRSQDRLQQQINLADGSVMSPDGSYLTRDRQQLRLRDGECINMDGEKFSNTYMHRKMLVQKDMNTNKNIMKKKVQKQPVTTKKKTKKPGN